MALQPPATDSIRFDSIGQARCCCWFSCAEDWTCQSSRHPSRWSPSLHPPLCAARVCVCFLASPLSLSFVGRLVWAALRFVWSPGLRFRWTARFFFSFLPAAADSLHGTAVSGVRKHKRALSVSSTCFDCTVSSLTDQRPVRSASASSTPRRIAVHCKNNGQRPDGRTAPSVAVTCIRMHCAVPSPAVAWPLRNSLRLTHASLLGRLSAF